MNRRYEKKIEKINNDRILMLNTVKDNIKNNTSSLKDNLECALDIFNQDEENTKEYKSIIKAKKLICELTEQIANASSVEEIVKLRKKVNYYINKIKKEMIRRNVASDELDRLYSNVNDLRSNYSKYIRFLKRQSNLDEIYRLYDNYDNLSLEETKRFRKLVSNEARYNKRINAPKKENKLIILPPKEFFDDNSENILENTSLPVVVTSFQDYQITDKSYSEENIDSRISRYKLVYSLSQTYSYDGGFLKNCFNFLRNIPLYNYNRRILKDAERDYNTFYHGEDLGGFIDYSKKRNSILTAISTIFKSSRLSERELECLANHELCKDWIMEFYNYNENDLSNSMRLVRYK